MVQHLMKPPDEVRVSICRGARNRVQTVDLNLVKHSGNLNSCI